MPIVSEKEAIEVKVSLKKKQADLQLRAIQNHINKLTEDDLNHASFGALCEVCYKLNELSNFLLNFTKP